MNERPYRSRDGFLPGIILALCLGFTDVSLAIVTRHPALASLGSIVPPAGAVAIVVLAVWVVAWFGVFDPFGRVTGINRRALAVSVAFFAGALFVLGDLNSYAPFARNPYKLGLILLISFIVGLGAHFACKNLMRSGVSRGRYRTAVMVLPVVLAETTLFQWIHHFQVGSFTSATAIVLAAAYVLTVILTFAFAHSLRRSRAVPVVVVVLFVALSTGSLALFVGKGSDSKGAGEGFAGGVRHVVLIIVDTLRADCLTCYNPDAPDTPNIDRLAAEGVTFRSAISPAPWTLPAVASIMSGLPVTVHGAVAEDSRLPDGLTMLAERMHAAGYRTDAIGRNPILAAPRNLDQGFGSFRFFPRSGMDGSVGTRILSRLASERYRSDASTTDLTDLALGYVNENAGEPFFFYVHYEDPHGPYAPPPEFRPPGEAPPAIGYRFAQNKQIRAGTLMPTPEEREWIKALYDGEVRYVDHQLGRLFDGMRAAGVYDDALIVLTSDHGEEFFEHGNVAHGHTLYNELLHVPLIVKLPGGGAGGEFVPFVSAQRIAPTILDVCGIEYDRGDFVGESLSEFWRRGDAQSTDHPYSTGVLYYENRESVIFDTMKLIRRLDKTETWLFDLNRDPLERRSLEKDLPVRLRRGQELLGETREISDAIRERLGLTGEESIELDAETIKRLKALGYM